LRSRNLCDACIRLHRQLNDLPLLCDRPPPANATPRACFIEMIHEAMLSPTSPHSPEEKTTRLYNLLTKVKTATIPRLRFNSLRS
jgi:hypothetical protein